MILFLLQKSAPRDAFWRLIRQGAAQEPIKYRQRFCFVFWLD
jgi:hypothetical protein